VFHRSLGKTLINIEHCSSIFQHPVMPNKAALENFKIYEENLSFLVESDLSGYSSLSFPWKVSMGKTFSVDVGNVFDKDQLRNHVKVSYKITDSLNFSFSNNWLSPQRRF